MCKLKKMLLGVLLKRRLYKPKQKVEVEEQDVILFQGQGNVQHAPSFMRPRCSCGTGRKQVGSRVITKQFISKRQSSKHTFISLRLKTVIGALECSFLWKELQDHFEIISFQSSNFLVNRKKKSCTKTRWFHQVTENTVTKEVQRTPHRAAASSSLTPCLPHGPKSLPNDVARDTATNKESRLPQSRKEVQDTMWQDGSNAW